MCFNLLGSKKTVRPVVFIAMASLVTGGCQYRDSHGCEEQYFLHAMMGLKGFNYQFSILNFQFPKNSTISPSLIFL